MQEVMGGTFAQQIICRSVPHRSEKDEEFYQASPAPSAFKHASWHKQLLLPWHERHGMLPQDHIVRH